MNKRKIIDGWVIIGIFSMVILIAINIPFTTEEPYTEQEPYTYTETYFEKEPYIEDVPFNITTNVNWNITDDSFNNQFDLKATIRNTDNVSGEFWVTFHVESSN